jgi:putative PIG3 family NAD(P)H quinone oxidoreductase
MKAILQKKAGGTEQFYIGETETPVCSENELFIKIKAAGLNRADILQRQGRYPPPPGASPIIGLEMAGVIEDIGNNVQGWKKGDRVCALLPGGGYAEHAVIPARMGIPIPLNFSFEEAASIPEAFLTAFQALVWIGQIKKGDTVLIHAGASGVGSSAIQLVKTFKARAMITAGSTEKLNFCRRLGAELAINYKDKSFALAVLEATSGKGVNIIIDFVGAPYWPQNIEALAVDGRIIILATMGGAIVDNCNLRDLFKKRGSLIASSLRSRSHDYKINLTQDFIQKCLPLFSSGKLKPVVDKIFPWDQVAKAHRYMEENRNMGKIVLNGM